MSTWIKNPETPEPDCRTGDSASLESRYPERQTPEVDAAALAYFIDFVRCSGAREACAYSNLVWVVSDSPKQIVFHFASHTVVVSGHRLQSIYEQVLAHTLVRIEEVDERYSTTSEDGPVVIKIGFARIEQTRTESDRDFPMEPETEGD